MTVFIMKRRFAPLSAQVRIWLVVCLAMLAAALSSCALVRAILGGAKVEKPEVEFAGVKLSGLSFRAADLVFNLRVTNPNPLGVSLSTYDYDLVIDGVSFIRGEQVTAADIPANGETILEVPVELVYTDLYRTIQTLGMQDSTSYQFRAALSFDLPLVGLKTIDVQTEGQLPLVRLPSVGVQALKLERLGLSGADLTLVVKVTNPNRFGFGLERMQYQLSIDGAEWASGSSLEQANVASNGEGLVDVPISLNFQQIGQSVYQVLRGATPLSYHLTGSFDLMTSLPTLGGAQLDFDKSGEVQLTR